MKCTFIVQKESQLAIFRFSLYSLSQVFNDIIDNQNIKRLCVTSLFMNKAQKYN